MNTDLWETVQNCVGRVSLGHDSGDCPGTGLSSAGVVLHPFDLSQAVTQPVIKADDIREELGLGKRNEHSDLTAALTAKTLESHVWKQCRDAKTKAKTCTWMKCKHWEKQKEAYKVHDTSSSCEAAIQRLWVIVTWVKSVIESTPPELPKTKEGMLGLSEQDFKNIKDEIMKEESCPFRKPEKGLKEVYEQYGFARTSAKPSKMSPAWKWYLWLKVMIDFEILFYGTRDVARHQAKDTLGEFLSMTILSETPPEHASVEQQRCKEKCVFCGNKCTQFLAVMSGTPPQVTDEGVFCDELKGEMCEVHGTEASQVCVTDIQSFAFQNGVFICKCCFPKTMHNFPPEILIDHQPVYTLENFFWKHVYSINPTNRVGVTLYISDDTSKLREKVRNVREIDHFEARHPETYKRLREDDEFKSLLQKCRRVRLTNAEKRKFVSFYNPDEMAEALADHALSRYIEEDSRV